MTKASDNAFPSILITEGTEPSAPAAGKQRLYIDSTSHHLMRTNSSGTETDIESGGSGIPATIIDAKGDLIAGSAADTAARHAVGTDGYHLVANSGNSTGLGWALRKTYLNKPAGNITRAATTVGAFSTAWQITGVIVISGQNVLLSVTAAFKKGGGDSLFALFRDSTQIASQNFGLPGANQENMTFTWIDENPGAATYTYEVRAAQFTSGTLTVYQTNITTDINGGTSIFTAEVYTP